MLRMVPLSQEGEDQVSPRPPRKVKAHETPFILTPEQIAEKAIMHDNAFLATVHDQWIRRYTEIFSS